VRIPIAQVGLSLLPYSNKANLDNKKALPTGRAQTNAA